MLKAAGESCVCSSINYRRHISVLGEAGEEQAWIMDGASAELQVLLYSSKER